MVIRGYKYDNLIVVDDYAYDLKRLYDAAYQRCVNSGGTAFDMPPFFYTGSPYGKEIKTLAKTAGIEPQEIPSDMDKAIVPHFDRKVWTTREPMWRQLFLGD